MTTNSKTTTLGEFGLNGGRVVYVVRTVPGKVREVKRLWKMLDTADASEQQSIIDDLVAIGSATRD